MGNIRVILKKSLEEFLSEYGIFVEVDEKMLRITEMYPPLPKELEKYRLKKVNSKSPLKKSNWKQEENIVEFENGEKRILLLSDLKWDKIIYKPFVVDTNLFFQCINFEDVRNIIIPKNIKNVVLDLRYHFGGTIKEMVSYYNFFTKAIGEKEIEKLYVLVSNATCSSAEIFVDKIQEYENTYIIGTETYGKKYIYHVVKDDFKIVYIPKFKIEKRIHFSRIVNFTYYYDIFYENGKRQYTRPDIWTLPL